MDTREAIKGILIEGAKVEGFMDDKIRVKLWYLSRNGRQLGVYYNLKDAEKAKAAFEQIPQYQAFDKIHENELRIKEETLAGYLTQAEFDEVSKVTEVTKKD